MIKYGSIYAVDGVPNLDSEGEKDRFVIILDPRLKTSLPPSRLLSVGASASTRRPSRVLLPNRDDHPAIVRTMPRRSWAVPEWIVLVPACALIGEPVLELTELQAKAIADSMYKAHNNGASLKEMKCLASRVKCDYCVPATRSA